MSTRSGSGTQADAAFRFIGDHVDPDKVTSLMGIVPSKAHAKGDPVKRRVGRRQFTGVWLLESPLARHRTLDQHLTWLLDVLEPRAAAIRELTRPGQAADFFCGVTITDPEDYRSFIRLEPGTLGRISHLGTPLEVHLYCLGECDGEEQGGRAG